MQTESLSFIKDIETIEKIGDIKKLKTFNNKFNKNKIEYSQNIPAERQKEVIKAFINFLDVNHTGVSSDPSNIEILIEKGEYDQVVNLFMVSEENEEVGTTQAESEILRKNFEKIYKRYLGDYSI